MQMRKLESKEHGRTRKLWEKVFTEDTKEFLDYYYFIKTHENEIYIIEENNQISSMLHLNPYTVKIEDTTVDLHYIVAVATEKQFRGRGYMRTLLIKAMEEMYRQKEPFTFLMPAAEAIYSPYDFRFIYDQPKILVKKPENIFPISHRDAGFSDLPLLEDFYKHYIADTCQVTVLHDVSYYQKMLLEQQSQKGGIRIVEKEKKIIGIFCYTRENVLEIRELLCTRQNETFVKQAIWELRNEKQEEVVVLGGNFTADTKKPLIMGRILHLQTLFETLNVYEGEEMDCSFAVLDSILIQNSRIWRIYGGTDTNYQIQVRETEDSEGVLTIEALTNLIFGQKSTEEICQEEHILMSEHLKNEWKKLVPIQKICLNEVV